jgi:uncharacterized Tic20 family protein
MLAVVAHLCPATAAAAALSHDPFTRAHGRAALRFQCSIALYLTAIVLVMNVLEGSIVLVQLVPFLLFVNLVLVLNALLFAIVAIHRAATGQTFTYPMTIGRT